MITGGLLFSFSTLTALRIAGFRRIGVRIGFALYGLTFGFWGLLMGAACGTLGGLFGIPHALMTGVLLYDVLRARTPFLCPLLSLIPAWGIALAAHVFIPGAKFDSLIFLAIYGWNGSYALMLCTWADRLDVRKFRAADNLCLLCEYDLTGLPSPICPECGTVAVTSESNAAPSHPDAQRA